MSRRTRVLVAAIGASMLAALSLAGSASAHQLNPYAWTSDFTGADSTAGKFSTLIGPMSIDQSTGHLLVLDAQLGTSKSSVNDWVDQFNAAGVSIPFAGLNGSTSLDTTRAHPSSIDTDWDIAADNTAKSVGFYVLNNSGGFRSFSFDGLERPNFPVETTGHALAVDPLGNPWIDNRLYSSAGKLVENAPFGGGDVVALAIDTDGNFYIARNNSQGLETGVYKYGPQGNFLFRIGGNNFVPALTVDPSDNHVFVVDGFGFGVTEYSPDGAPLQTFGVNDVGSNFSHQLEHPTGIAVNENTHAVYVSRLNVGQGGLVDVFVPKPPTTVPDTTSAAADPTPTSATLHGTVNPDGVELNDCHFEWGSTSTYGNSVECAEGHAFADSSDHAVSASVSGLELGKTYHYRLATRNGANNIYSYGLDRTFQAQGPAIASNEFVTEVNNDGARLHADIDPNGGDTTYRFEYATEAAFATAGYAGAGSVPASGQPLGSNLGVQSIDQVVTGLSPDTVYHYRVVATNAAASIPGTDRVFKTFPQEPSSDPCPNAHVRQQTSAALLLDCRAYELVSAANAGGYDVESDLIAGESPLPTSPDATDKLLYSLHHGVVPGIEGPTNLGLDPYVATRGADGWSTKYVGLPADGMPSSSSFGSPLAGMDPTLSEFAFGGQGICDPCFSDGSINMPLRLSDGSLVKGMAGSVNPAGDPAGHIGKAFSADGSHFVFGSKAAFEPDASSGDVTIYDRDLNTATTQIVSTTPVGTQMTGTDNAELDVSADGSRIVVAQKAGVDADGNVYWHPYMHIGASANSVDLAPGTTSGVLFDGMTADGTRVFFTTKDQLLPEDEDTSADIYEADVDQNGVLDLHLISVASTGPGNLNEPGNTDACTPVTDWNTVSGGPDCDAVALAGGAGVASGDGTFYFLSPEKLDTSGPTQPVQDQPNLYVVRPGSATHFVATIDDSNAKPPPVAPSHPLLHSGFATGFTRAAATAVDESDGSVYVFDIATNTVSKYNSSGGLVTSFGDSPTHDGHLKGTETPAGGFLSGPAFGVALPVQIAVDQSSGNLYVPDFVHEVVDVFSSSGHYEFQLSAGSFPLGVAVNPTNHNVYVSAFFVGTSVFTSSGTPVTTLPVGGTSAAIAVAPDGSIYAAGSLFGTAPAFSYDSAGNETGELDPNGTTNVAVDPENGDVYVDEGGQIAWFDAAGNSQGTVGNGVLAGSLGLAVNSKNKHVYATIASSETNSKLAEFGYANPPYQPIDDEAVIHAVSHPETHDFADFQITKDGHFAVFNSPLSLTGYDNQLHSEVYRYDAQSGTLACASCAPTGARATTDASLSSDGLDLTEDGHVFFTSPEPLVLRDTNGVKDAYEWTGAETQLISTGASPSDSGLLSVSPDGTDAYFFTRQILSPDDQNGAHMKIYDARAGGGFPSVPAQQPCKASDECHGPGTVSPAPLQINTVTGAGSGTPETHGCATGFVKKNGRCVKKHRPRHHHGKRRNRHAHATRRQG